MAPTGRSRMPADVDDEPSPATSTATWPITADAGTESGVHGEPSERARPAAVTTAVLTATSPVTSVRLAAPAHATAGRDRADALPRRGAVLNASLPGPVGRRGRREGRDRRFGHGRVVVDDGRRRRGRVGGNRRERDDHGWRLGQRDDGRQRGETD